MSQHHHAQVWEAYREKFEAFPDEQQFNPLDFVQVRKQFESDVALAYTENISWFTDRWGKGLRWERMHQIGAAASKDEMLLVINYLIDGHRMEAELKERSGFPG